MAKSEFKKAFDAARARGHRTFSYKGKIYNTMTKADAKDAKSRANWGANTKSNSTFAGNKNVRVSEATGWENEEGYHDGYLNDKGEFVELYGLDNISAKDATKEQKEEAIKKWKAAGLKGVWAMYLPKTKYTGPKADVDTDDIRQESPRVTSKKSKGPTRDRIYVGEADELKAVGRPKTNSQANEDADKAASHIRSEAMFDALGLPMINAPMYAKRIDGMLQGIADGNWTQVKRNAGDLVRRGTSAYLSVGGAGSLIPMGLSYAGNMMGLAPEGGQHKVELQKQYDNKNWVRNALNLPYGQHRPLKVYVQTPNNHIGLYTSNLFGKDVQGLRMNGLGNYVYGKVANWMPERLAGMAAGAYMNFKEIMDNEAAKPEMHDYYKGE